MSGCITCPWHGFQYKAEDGCSPPPFAEVLPTYPVRIVGDTIFLSPQALPSGAKSDGAEWPGAIAADDAEFFIGWQSKMAPALAGFLRAATIGLAALVPAVVGAVVWFQQPVDRGRFEYGFERPFEGVLYERPFPHLLVRDGDSARAHVLVGAGKFGPAAVIAGAHGHRVRFTGSAIVREPLHMIELNRPETFTVLDSEGDTLGDETPTLLGRGTFIGELVDTKCFSGVMRPAIGKVHRGCAIRCLSGGVPPGLLVRDPRGDGVVFLLASPDDAPLRYDVQLAGTFIEVAGTLELNAGAPVLRAASIRPLNSWPQRAAHTDVGE